MKITALLLALSAAAFAQGPLAPPAAPAPSMKTLDQIEPRTPIPNTPYDSSLPNTGSYFTVTRSGSYYLTGDISVPEDRHGIVIADGVNDVTLDLNGFTINIDTVRGYSGINMVGNHSRITIYNGNINNKSYAVGAGDNDNLTVDNYGGIVGGRLRNVLVSQVHVRNSRGQGINLNRHGTISKCSAHNCTSTGLRCETVIDSNASNCGYGGIFAKNATNCTASSTGTTTGLQCTGNAINCTGVSTIGPGIFCFGNAINCTGSSYYFAGLSCVGNATNCTGVSVERSGLFCEGNATNCTGKSSNGLGVEVAGTANACSGSNSWPGRVALTAGIAIGCISTSGTISSPQKHLGTL